MERLKCYTTLPFHSTLRVLHLQVESAYFCMVPLKCLYTLSDHCPAVAQRKDTRAIFHATARHTCYTLAYCYRYSRAHSTGALCCPGMPHPIFYAETPATRKTAGVSAIYTVAGARTTVRASAILDFKIHQSLVHKLIGYFAKCNRADKCACSFIFKI